MRCTVSVLRNGNGVELGVSDRRFFKGSHVQALREVVNGKEEKHSPAPILVLRFPVNGVKTISVELKYDPFREVCLGDYQKLPLEVKKLFFGYYGIK